MGRCAAVFISFALGAGAWAGGMYLNRRDPRGTLDFVAVLFFLAALLEFTSSLLAVRQLSDRNEPCVTRCLCGPVAVFTAAGTRLALFTMGALPNLMFRSS